MAVMIRSSPDTRAHNEIFSSRFSMFIFTAIVQGLNLVHLYFVTARTDCSGIRPNDCYLAICVKYTDEIKVVTVQ